VPPARGSLFDADVPEGFHYRDDFISGDEEARLSRAIAEIEFATFEMRGVAARRRVAFFGRTYEDGTAAAPLPGFLRPLRAQVAGWAGLGEDAFAMALINEYRPGTPIGWHRDAPQYGVVAGISLLSSCRLKFRPYVRPARDSSGSGRRIATHEILLEPRSAYSITLRTIRS
jgi:hypothetical protein